MTAQDMVVQCPNTSYPPYNVVSTQIISCGNNQLATEAFFGIPRTLTTICNKANLRLPRSIGNILIDVLSGAGTTCLQTIVHSASIHIVIGQDIYWHKCVDTFLLKISSELPLVSPSIQIYTSLSPTLPGPDSRLISIKVST